MDSIIQQHIQEFDNQKQNKCVIDISEDQKKESENDKNNENNDLNNVINVNIDVKKEQIQRDGELCKQYKDKGNDFFKQGQTNEALEMYELAEQYCEIEDNKTLSIVYSNMSICYDKHGDNDSVIEYTTKSIKANPQYLKPYLNRAEKYIKLEKYDEALQDYEQILVLEPNNKQYLQRKLIVAKLKEEQFEKQKNEALNSLKGLANTVLGKFNMSLDNFKLQQNENGSYNIQFKQ